MATLTIRDESTVGKTLGATRIELPESQVTVEEVIRSYVFQQGDCVSSYVPSRTFSR